MVPRVFAPQVFYAPLKSCCSNTVFFHYINIRTVRYKTHSRLFNYISEYIYQSLPLSRALSCDVRAARRSCPRAGGAAATETRWRSAQVERRRVEAMQRRKKRGARNSLPCALSCLKSNIHAEGGGGTRASETMLASLLRTIQGIVYHRGFE